MRHLVGLALLFAGVTLWAADPVFELHDGTRIRGAITALDQGVYSVHSDTLGDLKIRQQDIRSIDYGGARGGEAPAPSQAQIQSLQRDLAANGEIFALIQRLQSDPQMQDILADPEIMAAVSKGDLNALTSNEKFMRLLENPNIREITSKVAAEPRGN